jgi:transcription elongation factor GreA
MSRFPLTSLGQTTLQEEFSHRLRDRPALAERIQEAVADDTNLSENSEYQTALLDHQLNEARILELEDQLARAEVIDVSKLSGDEIKFGATVTLVDADTNEKRIWQLVGEPESDVTSGKISVNSPVGRALIGRKKGMTVEVLAPTGPKEFKITKVEWRSQISHP